MDTIEEVISKKPHLEAPLRFYEKSFLFTDAVKALGIPSRGGLNAYPKKFAGRIVEHFVSVFDMPEGSLAPLKQALELGEIDFMRLPLLEVPTFSLPYPEDDLITLLFLISRPFFLGMGDALPHDERDERFGSEGRCTVCNARPSLWSVTREGKHVGHCSFCGTPGRHGPVGCPVCLNKDAALLKSYVINKEKGFAAHTCAVCRSYSKTADGDLLDRMTPELADLISLPLDIMVQEKGFKRPSPNPIGMVRMSGRG